MARTVHALAVPMLVVVLSACGPAAKPQPQSPVEATNTTTLVVTIFVNGAQVGNVEPGAHTQFTAGQVGPLPWNVEARSPSGRVLVSFAVHEGDVWRTTRPDGSTETKSVGSRVDLTCGRLDVWVGTPMLGPRPDPSTLEDCTP